MSTTSVTQKTQETELYIPPPMGNYEYISEYRQLTESFVTIYKEEIEPLVTILDPEILVLEVRNFLKEKLETVGFETHAFYKIVKVDREPKFVIDLLITIPEFNRNKKFTILSVIGNLMRKYQKLLFDFRILKKKDVPEGYSII